jgi:CTP:molybdopterin cytidylyltransferase MocA
VLSAVVLAAGEARRMGNHLKALMPIEGSTFLGRVVETIARSRVGEIIVVLGFEHAYIRRTAEGRAAQLPSGRSAQPATGKRGDAVYAGGPPSCAGSHL